MAETETVLLLGETCTEYGRIEHHVLAEGRSAAALSAGGAPSARSAAAKFDPNEDAALVMDSGDAVLLAVADAHYGREASHQLLRGLARSLSPDLSSLHELAERLVLPIEEAPDPGALSATTLALAVYHRGPRRGFGISFGDSSVVLVGGAEPPRALTEKRAKYVSPGRPSGLSRENGQPFRFVGGEGRLLVVYTDGVDECHYGRPKTSIGLSHLGTLYDHVGPVPSSFARKLAEMALDGVDGHPGGEDNLAIAVATL